MSELAKLNPEEFGIEKSKALEITKGLQTVLAEREVLKASYKKVLTLEVTKENIPVFKELRIRIRDNRTKGIDAWHKVNKDFYLRGGQFVDAIKRKEVLENQQMEEKLEEAEKFFENQEKERIIKLHETRLQLISEFVEDTTGLDFGNMEDEVFEGYLSLKKTQKAEKLEAERIAEEKRIEEENKVKLHNERKEVALPFYQFWTDFEKTLNFGEQSESDFNSFMDRLKTAKQSDDDEKEKQRIENVRLKKEQEAKDELRKTRSPLLQPYIVFIRDYNTLIDKPESEFVKELEEIKKGAELQWEHDREEMRKETIRVQKEAKDKAEKELEEKARAKAILEEEKAKKEAEQLAKTPIKEQLTIWVNCFEIPLPKTANQTTLEIAKRFNGFKEWAKSEIDKI